MVGLPPIAELRQHLARQLPEQLIPTVYVELSSLPLTANGKLDRKALPDPDQHRAAATTVTALPSTPIEHTLHDIWAEVLHTDAVGVHDNFFELGGHSLLATQVVSRVRAAFHTEITVAALFDTPTIAGLAAVLSGQMFGEEPELEEFRF
ncbi:MAG TPA: phosphopantetheine-binding protein [Dactylosporangium sp.]|nr:phosphopantetheine-binding protein [Dactylosporangium sp.]